MKNFKSIAAGLYMAVAAMGVTATSAQAALINNGSTTIDTVAQLEWVDNTLTTGQSYNSIIGGFGGYVTAGYHIATTAEVCSLFSSLGDVLPNCNGAQIGDAMAPPNAATIATLLGDTPDGGLNTCGIFDNGVANQVGLAEISSTGAACVVVGTNIAATLLGWTSYTTSQPVVGVWLTRSTIPEPSNLALFGLGLVGLGLARHRKAA